MRLPLLKYLLLDCTGLRAKDWFYNVGCLVSAITAASCSVALLTYCLDYSSRQPLYHSLAHSWHSVAYTGCLVCALLTALPPLVLGVMAVRGVHYERHSVAARLCGLAKFDNFYCPGSATRYLFLSTVCSAGTILFNTASVGILSLGVGALFTWHWSDRMASVASLQRHFDCCGLKGHADWATATGRVPVSCRLANASSLALPEVQAQLQRQRQHQRLQPGYNSTTAYVPVSSAGCATPLTSELAVACSIANMLIFSGILLLVASWTRAERVAEISARDLRSKNFADPRHGDKAAEFLEKHMRRHRAGGAGRSVRGSSTSPSQSSSSRCPSVGSTTDDASSGVNSKQMSDGFLVTTDSDTSQSRNSLGSNSESTDGGHKSKGKSNNKGGSSDNENNSALDLSGPWLAARVVNSLSREMLMWGIQQHQLVAGAEETSVCLVDEALQRGDQISELDARRLLTGADASAVASGGPTCCSHRSRSGSCNRRAAAGAVIRSREPPLLLDALLTSQRSRCRRVTFHTEASGRFPGDFDS